MAGPVKLEWVTAFGGGGVRAGRLFGDTALAAFGPRLAAFSFQRDAAPMKVGEVSFPAPVHALAMSENIAVTLHGSDISVVDIENTLQPSLRARRTCGDCRSVAVSGTAAFVARGQAGLDVWDLANPESPRRVQTIAPGDGSTTSLVASIPAAAESGPSGRAGLREMVDPESLTQVSLAVLSESSDGASVELYDTSIPLAPRSAAAVSLTQRDSTGLAATRDTLYAISPTEGLAVIRPAGDHEDQGDLRFAATHHPDLKGDGVSADERYAYLGSRGGLTIVEVLGPGPPRILGKITDLKAVLEARDGRLLLSDGLRTLAVGDAPAPPRLLGEPTAYEEPLYDALNVVAFELPGSAAPAVAAASQAEVGLYRANEDGRYDVASERLEGRFPLMDGDRDRLYVASSSEVHVLGATAAGLAPLGQLGLDAFAIFPGDDRVHVELLDADADRLLVGVRGGVGAFDVTDPANIVRSARGAGCPGPLSGRTALAQTRDLTLIASFEGLDICSHTSRLLRWGTTVTGVKAVDGRVVTVEAGRGTRLMLLRMDAAMEVPDVLGWADVLNSSGKFVGVRGFAVEPSTIHLALSTGELVTYRLDSGQLRPIARSSLLWHRPGDDPTYAMTATADHLFVAAGRNGVHVFRQAPLERRGYLPALAAGGRAP